MNPIKQVTLLREAGFSWKQIVVLWRGGTAAETVLADHRLRKQQFALAEQRTIEAIEGVFADGTITAKTVCEKLNESKERTPLSEPDYRPTVKEQVEQWVVRILAAACFVFWTLIGIGLWDIYRDDFPIACFYTEFPHFIGIGFVAISIVLSFIVLLLYRKYYPLPKVRKRRRVVAIIVLVVLFLNYVVPIGPAFLSFIPPVYSETSDPGQYLVLGDSVRMYGNSIYKLFPANIPRCAIAEDSDWYPPDRFLDTTKYYYYFDDVVDPSFHIYAEWVLPPEDFIEELERIDRYYPDGPQKKAQWGNWTCFNFTNDTLLIEKAKELTSYTYFIFAYNESTHTVRYIASYGMDHPDHPPYFLRISWD